MKKLLFVLLMLATLVACTDPMEETLNNGIDGDPITIKQ